MNILVAPNAFKGSISAPDAADIMADGIRVIDDDIEVTELPVADGGDGTLEAFVESTNGTKESIQVLGPRQDEVTAELGFLGNENTAIIEMARASGLVLLDEEERNPMKTTTYGTGQLIRHAIEKGCDTIIVGIGGSATVDGGTGMARALGYEFYDDQGEELPQGGGALDRLSEIRTDGVLPELQEVDVYVACDVGNPLTGKRGASRVYGPQKGATPDQVEQLEQNLCHFQEVLKDEMGLDVSELEGGGAAGGLGAGLYAFCDAELKPGVELVFERIGFEEALAESDLVLTGEGEVDRSSLEGKAAVEVARRSSEHNVHCLLMCGSVDRHDPGLMKDLRAKGVTAIFSISTGPMTLDVSMTETRALLKNATEQIVSAFIAGKSSPSRKAVAVE
jgi:glycerate kinase